MTALAYWLCFLSNCAVMTVELVRYIRRRRANRALRAAAAKAQEEMSKAFAMLQSLCECPDCKRASEAAARKKVLQ